MQSRHNVAGVLQARASSQPTPASHDGPYDVSLRQQRASSQAARTTCPGESSRAARHQDQYAAYVAARAMPSSRGAVGSVEERMRNHARQLQAGTSEPHAGLATPGFGKTSAHQHEMPSLPATSGHDRHIAASARQAHSDAAGVANLALATTPPVQHTADVNTRTPLTHSLHAFLQRRAAEATPRSTVSGTATQHAPAPASAAVCDFTDQQHTQHTSGVQSCAFSEWAPAARIGSSSTVCLRQQFQTQPSRVQQVLQKCASLPAAAHRPPLQCAPLLLKSPSTAASRAPQGDLAASPGAAQRQQARRQAHTGAAALRARHPQLFAAGQPASAAVVGLQQRTPATQHQAHLQQERPKAVLQAAQPASHAASAGPPLLKRSWTAEPASGVHQFDGAADSLPPVQRTVSALGSHVPLAQLHSATGTPTTISGLSERAQRLLASFSRAPLAEPQAQIELQQGHCRHTVSAVVSCAAFGDARLPESAASLQLAAPQHTASDTLMGTRGWQDRRQSSGAVHALAIT